MTFLIYILIGSALLAFLFYGLVMKAPTKTPDQCNKVAGAALVLAVISLLWILNIIRLTWHYFR